MLRKFLGGYSNVIVSGGLGQFTLMFGVAERAPRMKRVLKRQEWWFTLEPNPVPEVKWWDAQIEGQWWICWSDGKGNFHINKATKKNGPGINEEGLFDWLAGFGIERTCVVKWGTKYGKHIVVKKRDE